MARRDKLWSSSPFVEDFHVFRSRLLQSHLPSRDKRVRWHVETNYGHLAFLLKTSMSFDRHYYSLFFHPETSESVGTRKLSWSSVFIVFKTIEVSLAIQRQASPLACGDDHGLPLFIYPKRLSEFLSRLHCLPLFLQDFQVFVDIPDASYALSFNRFH